jgi:hypothetical protein
MKSIRDFVGENTGKRPVKIWRRTVEDTDMEAKAILYACGK